MRSLSLAAWTFRTTIAFVLVSGVFRSTTGLAFGADDKPPATSTRTLGDSKPSRKSQARYQVPFFDRVIHIHQADGTDAGSRGLYFYRPLLALVENGSPLPGYPPIVLKAKDLADGAVRLSFASLLSLPEFEPVALAQIAEDDAESLRTQKIRPEQAKVAPWPILHAVVDCKIEGEDEPLASGQTDSLASSDSMIRFSMTFTREALAKFRRGITEKEVVFAFSYSFEGRKVAEGSVTTAASREVRASVEQDVRNHLTEPQRKGIAPIFQQQLVSIERDVRVRTTRVIRAQHKDLFPILSESSGMVGRLIELDREFTVDDLQGDKALTEAVSQYLRPLVQSWAKADEKTRKLGTEDETKRTTTNTNKNTFGLKLPIKALEVNIGAEVESTITDERRQLLTSEYGLTTKEDESGQFYVPYSIKVYKYGGSKTNSNFEDSTVAFLAIGENDQYLQDTSIPAEFTATRLKAFIGGSISRPKTVGDTVAEALAAATVELAKSRDDLATRKTAFDRADGASTVAQNTLVSAKAELAAASAKLPDARAKAEKQEAVVRGMPTEIAAIQGPMRGSLGGGRVKVPMKPNPALPAAEQTLRELQADRDRAIANEAAAQIKVNNASTAASLAANDSANARRLLAEVQEKVTRIESKSAALQELLKSPPRP